MSYNSLRGSQKPDFLRKFFVAASSRGKNPVSLVLMRSGLLPSEMLERVRYLSSTTRDFRKQALSRSLPRDRPPNFQRISDNRIGELSNIEEKTMVATTSELPKIDETPAIAPAVRDNFTLEDFMANPPDNMEWVDGQVVEKNDITLKTGRIQSRLDRSWGNYKDSSRQGGETYIEVPCRTKQQVRRPDVAYLTPELVAQFGDVPTLPQSFPLIAEIVSPTDIAEDVFLKAQEYLASSCQEVWLVFPESRLIFVMTQEQILTFRSGDTASTQQVLLSFSIEVDRLLG